MIPVKKYSRFLRISVWRVLNEPHNSHAVAMGAAVGTAIGFGPTFGFQLIPVVAISLRYRYSKIAAVSTVFITNPLTILPIYSFEMYLGDKIWGNVFDANISQFLKTLAMISKNTMVDTVEIDSVSTSYALLLELGRDTLLVFITGSIICSIVSGIIAYFVTKVLVEKWRRRKLKSKAVSLKKTSPNN